MERKAKGNGASSIDSLVDVYDEENDTFSELPINNNVNGIRSVKSHPKYVRIVISSVGVGQIHSSSVLNVNMMLDFFD
ncbi:hypothetical protein MTR_1g029480 [Medicago truncatula]|uniref:Uncharacterized protein n=1 Tax=Medicago truncatula TaxID=3880 RepID=A0A072VGD3_MEDTR|nr:hypothetical protein MTR_1g029480 [Medicago truncatula]